jgi:hypothetical protein
MLNIATIEKRLSGISEGCSAAFTEKLMNINTAICISMVLRARSQRISVVGGFVTYQNKPSLLSRKLLSVTRIVTYNYQCVLLLGRKR